MAELSGLTIRQHERDRVDLEVDFVVADAYRDQVRFSSGSPAVGRHVVRGRTEDVSSGGIGMVVRQFVPKMTEGVVRIYGTVAVDQTSDGTPVFEVIFEHAVKVRRIYMSSHEPTYAVGVSFVDPGPHLEMQIRAVGTLAASAAADRDGPPPAEAADA